MAVYKYKIQLEEPEQMGQKLSKPIWFMLRTSIANKTFKIEEAVSKSRGHPITELCSNRGKWLIFKHGFRWISHFGGKLGWHVIFHPI